MTLGPFQVERSRTPRGGWLRRGLMIGIGLAAIAAAIFFYCVSRVDRQMRQYVEDVFNEHYASKNLRVTVGSARLVEGKGVDIRDLVFFDIDRGEDEPIAVMEQLFNENHATLHDLVTDVPPPQRVFVRGLRLRATRMADGSWDALRLFPPPRFSDRMAPVFIENGTLELADPANKPASRLVLRDVQVSIQPDYGDAPAAATVTTPPSTNAPPTACPPLHIRADFTSKFFPKMEVDAFFDPTSGEWKTAGAVADFEISPELRASLPREAAEPLVALAGLRSEASIRFRFAGRKTTAGAQQPPEPVKFTIWGDVRRGVLEDERLPLPLTDLSCRLYCDNSGVSIEELVGRIGSATIRGAGQQFGWRKGSPLTLSGSATQLSLDDLALYRVMPQSLRERAAQLSAQGFVDVDVRLEYDGRGWLPDVTVKCRDVSFLHEEFKYRLSNTVGKLTLKDNVLDIDLVAQSEGGPVRIKGTIEEPGPNYTGWVEVDCEKAVPISSSLVGALPEKTRNAVESLRMTGEATVWARIERLDPRVAKPHWQLRIGLRECSIKYAKFEYPLSRIGGVLECRDGAWKFRDLFGYNGSAYITCQGGWTPGDPNEPLWFDFVAADTPLDEELRRALSPAAQKLWSSMRLRGTLDDLRIGLKYFADRRQLSLDVHAEKRQSDQNIEGRSITIEPQWLPYRIDDVTGSVRYRDGVIELADMQGWHGRTRMAMQGALSILREGGWKAEFCDVVAERLYADHDLVSALPPAMSSAVSKLQLTGPARAFGDFTIAKGPSPEAPLEADWDVTIDAVGAGVDCGVPLASIQGGVRLVGRLDDTGLKCRGEIGVDSLMVNGHQITDVSGPVWIDETAVLLGAWAEPAKAATAGRRLTGQLMGGVLSIDARVKLNTEKDFLVHADFRNGDLATIARELAPRQRITGKAHGSVRLEGSQKGRHTWRGTGQVRLREANIYEMPVMMSMFKVLSARDPDQRAFTTSDIDFQIQDERAYLDKIDFKGNAITLKGRGEVDLDGRLNVNFYTLLGRDEFWAPVVTRVWGEASQQVLLIHARGTLQAPEVTKEAFPGVNEALAQMFPELAARRQGKK